MGRDTTTAPDAFTLDSGAQPDSGVGPDGGVIPRMDSGAVSVDSGTTPLDAGVDFGVWEPEDSGVITEPPDSGVRRDAGPSAGGEVLERVFGHGMLLLENFPATRPLAVRVVDRLGSPRPDVLVTWTATSGRSLSLHSYYCLPSRTDDDGIATCQVVGSGVTESWEHNHVQASIETGSVAEFIVTVTDNGGGWYTPQIEIATPEGGVRVLPALSVGSTHPGAIRAVVAATTGFMAGQPIPNVSLRLTASDGSHDPSEIVTCGTSGFALTDASGFATCDVRGIAPGTQFYATVGESTRFNFMIEVR